MSELTEFDAVIIGSGLGGLTAAALLAKAGRSVCLLERNRGLGGAASIYKVGALTIEASLHQTADPRDPRDVKHQPLKELGVLDAVEWVPAGPLYSVEGGPVGEPFTLPHGFEQAREALAQRFPRQPGAGRLLERMERLFEALGRLTQAREEHSLRKAIGGAAGLGEAVSDWRASAADIFARELGDDEAAKFALAANLGYYSDDPRRLWWLFFAIAQGGYLGSGGVYVKGGSRVLSLKLGKAIKDAGGAVRLGREAVAIETDRNGAPAAVRFRDPRGDGEEERIGARAVLANCAPRALSEMLGEAERKRLDAAFASVEPSISLFCAHFGVSEAPARFGLEGYSTILLPDWITNLNAFAQSAELLGEKPSGRLPPMTIANYGAIESAIAPAPPTLVTVAGTDRLSNWTGLTPEAEKERRAAWLDAILERLEKSYPGFAGAVTEKMFISARSIKSYLGCPYGEVYGFAPTPPQRPAWAGPPRSPATPLPGVYLASSYGGSGGFSGAIASGADAARMALRRL
jgi:all-trans-retinol 13,14-reductase